ncbi:hypothetical protein HDU97_009318 [Phlyctochytrium planicorne]|nr:hypothetical protein HDU97_009318 [Phlyctochytrium planicorne]
MDGSLASARTEGSSNISPPVNQDCAAVNSMVPFVDPVNCCGSPERQNVGYYEIECSSDGSRIVKLNVVWNVDGPFDECQLKICPFVSMDAITTLTELVWLRFRTTFPKDLGRLKKLEYLNFVLDVYGPLPDSLNELSNLKEMYVSIPKPVVHFTSLVNLRAYQKPLAKKNSIQFLSQKSYLSENEFTSIPTEISNLTNLKTLHMNSVKVDDIGSIRDLPHLEDLSVGSPQLASAPVTLATLTSLQSLYYCFSFVFLNVIRTLYGKIQDIEGDFSALVNLKALSLDSTRLHTLKDFRSPPNLEEVRLGYCEFEIFPDAFQNVSSLKTISFQSNYLKSLPEFHKFPPNLSMLDIRNNCIPAAVNVSLPFINGLDDKRNQEECDGHVIPADLPSEPTSTSSTSSTLFLSTRDVVATTGSASPTGTFSTLISNIIPTEPSNSRLPQVTVFAVAPNPDTPTLLPSNSISPSQGVDRPLPSDVSGPTGDDSNSRSSFLKSNAVLATLAATGVILIVSIALLAVWISRRRRARDMTTLEPSQESLEQVPSNNVAETPRNASSLSVLESGSAFQGREYSSGKLFPDDEHQDRLPRALENGGKPESGLFAGTGVLLQTLELPESTDSRLAEQPNPSSTAAESILEWSVSDVWAWINSIGFREDVADTFRHHQIDGQRLLGLTDRILEEELGFADRRLRSSILTIRYKTFMEGPNLAEHFLPRSAAS